MTRGSKERCRQSNSCGLETIAKVNLGQQYYDEVATFGLEFQCKLKRQTATLNLNSKPTYDLERQHHSSPPECKPYNPKRVCECAAPRRIVSGLFGCPSARTFGSGRHDWDAQGPINQVFSPWFLSREVAIGTTIRVYQRIHSPISLLRTKAVWLCWVPA